MLSRGVPAGSDAVAPVPGAQRGRRDPEPPRDRSNAELRLVVLAIRRLTAQPTSAGESASAARRLFDAHRGTRGRVSGCDERGSGVQAEQQIGGRAVQLEGVAQPGQGVAGDPFA